MKLTDERIRTLWYENGCAYMLFAFAIAAEQRKIDAEICKDSLTGSLAVYSSICAEAILKEGE